MTYQAVNVERRGATGWLTLNRPDKMNALDAAMAREVLEAARELLGDDQVRALVITGQGKAFSAGGDVRFLESSITAGDVDGAMSLVRLGGQLVRLLRESPKPVLAALNGVAAGGGANLALACDLRIASEAGAIGQVFHRLGLHPDWGGSFFLPRLVGTSRALELIWSAEIVPAARCLELGLVNRVVPAEQLESATREWAERLAAAPPIAAGLAKAAVYHAERRSLDEALVQEESNQEACFRSADAREGFVSFKAKRAPVFEGK